MTPFQTRTPWYNHSRNQSILPLRIYWPTSLADLVSIVRDAEEEGVTARAVGSHHSWSDAALSTGFMIETHKLNQVLELESDLYHPGVDLPMLVRAEAGIRLRELNAALDATGRGLIQMGGYDEQTVGGVLSTATHGSGLNFGAITDYLVSVDIVASGGQTYRIEPKDGPTDPRRFAHHFPGWTLKQDDDWFDAVRVGVGCLGVIYAATLRVRKKFFLKEVRKLSTWKAVKRELNSGDVLRNTEHYEVLVNPHPTLPDRDYRCLITTREEISDPGKKGGAARQRPWLTEFLAGIGPISWMLGKVFAWFPGLVPGLIDRGLKALKDSEYSAVSYKVYNVGNANLLPAVSSEIGVPVESTVQAVDEVLKVAEKWRTEGNVYHSSPISLRFVKGSTACLSMMQGRDTMMMELILFHPTTGGPELLASYEERLGPLGGRPHWGQINVLAGDHTELIKAYPRFPTWKQVHKVLNASGVFNSPFSKRVGIDDRGYLP